MKLVVISPESPDHPGEFETVRALLERGLDRYHVRKPGVSAPALSSWLSRFTPAQRRHFVLHQHHELVAPLGLGGRHFPTSTRPAAVGAVSFNRLHSPGAFRSTSAHRADELVQLDGHFHSVFFSPVFPSISKPGHSPDPTRLAEVSSFLRARSASTTARSAVLALGGIDAANASRARSLGFDGVAVLGAIWNSPDPLSSFDAISEALAAGQPRPASVSLPALMCLTHDAPHLSHAEQARRLCAAGAGLIQLRMKNAPDDVWLATAREVVSICHRHGTRCIVNDRVDLARQAGADGAHVNRRDHDWIEARRQLGSDALLGGTVNDLDDAACAVRCGVLDYVGVGPWRFTPTKQKLSPIQGESGVRALVDACRPLPAFAIGGIDAADFPAVQSTGAAGVAITSALYRDGAIESNFHALRLAWHEAAVPAVCR